MLLPLCYLGWSLFCGRRAGANPWQATGLEWQTSVAAAEAQFRATPVVTRGPYHYTPKRRRSRRMPDRSPAPQFADLRQQSETAQLGMWVFLATEVLFFGGLLLPTSPTATAIPPASPRPRATPRSSSAPSTPPCC